MKRSEQRRERTKEALVKSLALGASVLAACVGVQIGRSTFYRWLDGDASFEEAVMAARLGLVQEVMSELRLLAWLVSFGTGWVVHGDTMLHPMRRSSPSP